MILFAAVALVPAAAARQDAGGVDITGGPSGTTTSTTATFTFTVGGDLSSARCSLDGSVAVACTSPTTYSALALGSHAFTLTGYRNTTQVSGASDSRAWTIVAADTTPPETTITTAVPPLTGSAVSIAFVSDDPTASFRCSLNGAPAAPCTSPASYSKLGTGPQTFSVFATDPSSNVDATPASVSWTVDATPPETTITGPPILAQTAVTSATFAFVSNEPGSTFQCSLDGAPYALCTSPASYPSLAQGAHTFTVYAVDAIGNADPTPASKSWVIDNTPPIPQMLKPDQTFTLGKPIYVSWSATDVFTGVVKYDVRRRAARYDGDFVGYANWQTNTVETSSVYVGTVGYTYCFKVRATDGTGNTSNWSSEACTAIPVPASALKIENGKQWDKPNGGVAVGHFLNRFIRPASEVHDYGNDEYSNDLVCGLGICGDGGSGWKVTLAGARPVRFALIAAKCATCGGVWVFLNPWQFKPVYRLLETAGPTKKKQIVMQTVHDYEFPKPLLITLFVYRGRPMIEGFGISRAPIVKRNKS
jgi:hypothetical protein